MASREWLQISSSRVGKQLHLFSTTAYSL
jgi:hypothetical protein